MVVHGRIGSIMRQCASFSSFEGVSMIRSISALAVLFALWPTASWATNYAPTVTMVNPANGATISGQIVLQATAHSTPKSDGISYLQFQVDNVNVGPKLTVAPYTYSLDTTKYSNGSHTIRAIAQDKVNGLTA